MGTMTGGSVATAWSHDFSSGETPLPQTGHFQPSRIFSSGVTLCVDYAVSRVSSLRPSSASASSRFAQDNAQVVHELIGEMGHFQSFAMDTSSSEWRTGQDSNLRSPEFLESEDGERPLQ